MRRILAVDVGMKRTGLAIGDSLTGVVTPLGTLHSAKEDERMAWLVSNINGERPDEVVFGLPLHMSGTESEMSKFVRDCAVGLQGKVKAKIFFVDERQTSQLANASMAKTGLTYKQKKNRRDALAATEILKRYLQLGGEQLVTE